MLGASNLWFGVTASALHLPQGQTVEDMVAAHWDILGAQPNTEVAQAIIEGMDALRGLRGHPIEEVWACIEKLRAAGGPAAAPEPPDLRMPNGSCCPGRQQSDRTRTSAPSRRRAREGYDRLLDQVVLVSRLREVRALVGFTRVAAPERGDLEPVSRVPLSRSAPGWVPAVEQRGEGIFLQLREDAVTRGRPGSPSTRGCWRWDGAYRRWAHNHRPDSQQSIPASPG